MRFNIDDHYHLNGFLLTVGTVIGLVLVGFTHSIIPLVICAAASQYKWISDLLNRLIHPDDVKALEKISTSGKLADNKDSYTFGRYKDAANFKVKRFSSHILISIDPNGIKNAENITDLAGVISDAYGRPAYLVKRKPGLVVYRIDLEDTQKEKVSEDDF
ncbi:hypothetical protein J2Z60_000472 [Lactobacillus colini]|uniref:Uncharacterized protein n=1 Tax=Lactobacillus colini TaxID=1819254 RepID=A0ABS4MCA6_9LACO|nr:hypothetical protein [Lactobacillus colini]MBP2057308.1 hypothetical protein [Lactobacillus colini]